VWTTCTQACGGGVRGRQFEVDIDRAPAGCGVPKLQEAPCNVEECAVDCVAAWSRWGNCDAVCGKGHRKRDFEVRRAAAHGGVECAEAAGKEETEVCTGQNENTPLCAGLSCEGEHSEWGECSQSCGGGVQNRTFRVTRRRQPGGGFCESQDGQLTTQPCNTHGCPLSLDCKGKWNGWSRCSARCEGGTKRRRYQVIEREQGSGGVCSLRGAEEVAGCNEHPCAVHCRGGWGPWTECTNQCGGGLQSRRYTVLSAAANNGDQCAHAESEHETQMCNKQQCAVNCIGGFGPWSGTCPKCGKGDDVRIMRTFSVDRPARDGGTECQFPDGYLQKQECDVPACDVDCKGSYSKYSNCSRKCGGGTKRRRWTKLQDSEGSGGAACPLTDGETETTPCSTQPC